MLTLHIEHPVTDFSTWQAAFARLAPVRQQAGVRSSTVRRPVDDLRFVSIDLDFDTRAGAEGFLEMLQTRVWSSPDNSPALIGKPKTRIFLIEEEQES